MSGVAGSTKRSPAHTCSRADHLPPPTSGSPAGSPGHQPDSVQVQRGQRGLGGAAGAAAGRQWSLPATWSSDSPASTARRRDTLKIVRPENSAGASVHGGQPPPRDMTADPPLCGRGQGRPMSRLSESRAKRTAGRAVRRDWPHNRVNATTPRHPRGRKSHTAHETLSHESANSNSHIQQLPIAVAREPGGGLVGAEPLQFFGWGARNVFAPPPNTRNRGLLSNDNC